ncbi:MAG TPA: L-histidine N(alpha)-methyltransferase [Patescibacteria group bacterium]|nr:L-histidine N(alpha)-methyltransferase [Patescibacteria group bacterium]
MNENQILTIQQAARLLQVDPNTIYRWARAGKFPASKIGKEWRVLRSDVIKFVESKKRRSQFLTAAQEAELITALAGRREIPLKFEYLGEGADRYVAISAPDIAGGSEVEMISENKEKFVDYFRNKELNLLDVGPGDGNKAAYLISHITKRVSSYAGLDISERMLDLAGQTMQIAHPELTYEQFTEDFEHGSISNATYYLNRRYQKNNLILFLGNTIANLSDAHRVLINLRDGMSDQDLLMVGLAFYNEKNIPIQSYNSSAVELLWTVPEKLGITPLDAKIYWTYNARLRQLECQLEFVKNWNAAFGGNHLRFGAGQKVRLAISRRFTKDDIFELFAKAGFKIEIFVHDRDNALILCKPHNWEKRI